MAQSPDELFDVVDAWDQVIGQAPRGIVHRDKLLHRAVHVFVLNSRGDLLLQMRSAQKDEFPLCYTSSASGHLDAGETHAEAGARELGEELGLTGPLEWLGKLPAGPETAHEHTVLLRLVTDAAPRIHADEIAAVEFRSLADVDAEIEQNPSRFSPPFVTLFRWYVQRARWL